MNFKEQGINNFKENIFKNLYKFQVIISDKLSNSLDSIDLTIVGKKF